MTVKSMIMGLVDLMIVVTFAYIFNPYDPSECVVPDSSLDFMGAVKFPVWAGILAFVAPVTVVACWPRLFSETTVYTKLFYIFSAVLVVTFSLWVTVGWINSEINPFNRLRI